jgi:hypothetical protein
MAEVVPVFTRLLRRTLFDGVSGQAAVLPAIHISLGHEEERGVGLVARLRPPTTSSRRDSRTVRSTRTRRAPPFA